MAIDWRRCGAALYAKNDCSLNRLAAWKVDLRSAHWRPLERPISSHKRTAPWKRRTFQKFDHHSTLHLPIPHQSHNTRILFPFWAIAVNCTESYRLLTKSVWSVRPNMLKYPLTSTRTLMQRAILKYIVWSCVSIKLVCKYERYLEIHHRLMCWEIFK